MASWTWLLKLLIDLAIRMGLPYLMQKWAWIPSEIWAMVSAALEALAKSQDKPARIAVMNELNAKLRECHGSFCAPEVKR